MGKIKVALVEDQRLFRDGLFSLLNASPEFEMIGVADNGLQFEEVKAMDGEAAHTGLTAELFEPAADLAEAGGTGGVGEMVL